MSPEDRPLEELLGRALRTEIADPPADGIAAVRARAEAGRSAIAFPDRRRRRTLAAAIAVAAAVIAFGVGLIVGEDLPRPIRAAAHAIGLPVDSPGLVDTENALRELGVAIEAGDARAVEKLDDHVLALVHTLDEGERAEIEPVVHQVHHRALEFLAEHGEGSSGHAHD